MSRQHQTVSSCAKVSHFFSHCVGLLASTMSQLSFRKVALSALLLLATTVEVEAVSDRDDKKSADVSIKGCHPLASLQNTIAAVNLKTISADSHWREASASDVDHQDNKEIAAIPLTPTKEFSPLLSLRDEITSHNPSTIDIVFPMNDGQFNSFFESYAQGQRVGDGRYEITITSLDGFLLHLDELRFTPSCKIA